MNTSISRSITSADSEPREQAMGTEGRSRGDWLDEVIAERPSQGDPGSGDRRADMDAIAAEMHRFSTAVETRELQKENDEGESRAAPAGPSDVGARRFASEDAIRNAVAEIARRQADLDRDATASGDSRATETSVEPPSRAADQAADMKGTAVARGSDDAVDVGPRPQDPAHPAADPQPAAARHAGTDLGAEVAQTFARFARDLQEAIHATDARPAIQDLNRQVRQIGRAVDGIGAGMPPVEAPARIGEQQRDMRDLLSTTAGSALPVDPPKGQVTGLNSRPTRSATQQDSVASTAEDATAEGTLAEVRTLLDNFKPGAAIASLESRLDDLSSRIARGLDDKDPAGLIEGLSRRVDEIHASLRSQLAESAIDTRPLEGLMRGISDRIGQAREASSDFTLLETAMRDFATRMDGAEPGTDRHGVQAVEAQISRLAERLDRSESSLRSLDGVEQSLHELFSQFEVTRQVAIDAAETAARTAARDTLRAALQNPTLGMRSADGSAGLADQMARGIEDLRSMQELAERRTQVLLAEMRGSIERLAQQMAGRDDEETAKADGAAPRRRGRVRADAASVASEPPAAQAQHGKGDGSRSAEDPADLLIEPGLGRGQQSRTEPRFDNDRETGPASELPIAAASSSSAAEGEGPASFIAAARRAAQAAQASAASTAAMKITDRRLASRGVATSRGNAASETGTVGRAKAYLARRRRPILLGLAALVLLVGALEVVNVGLDVPGVGRIGLAGVGVPEAAHDQTAESGVDARRAVASAAQVASTPAAMPATGPAATPKPPAAAQAAPPARPPLPSFVAGSIKPQGPANDGIGEALRSVASAGDPAAQYEVGLRFADGRGVDRDPKQAFGWFEKAAQQGLAPAQYRVGSMYEKGVGADRNPALAMSWYGKAADAGNIRAMHNMAVMAAEGAVGKPDYVKAAQWFQKASGYGVRDSQFNLAILYARGLGIEQSFAQSYTWFAIAASQGDDDAAKKRDEVAQKLDAATLASAKAAADAFRPTAQTTAANEVAAPPGGWDAVAPRASSQAPASAAAGAKVSRL